jgi:mono/diheme cytochrome c family protein
MNATPFALLLAAFVLDACGTSRERERFDFERMRVQQRYTLFGTSRTVAGGQSMRAPPGGTVSREALAERSEAPPSITAAFGIATIPIAVTPQLVARGKDRFIIYCAVCHGAGGFGGSLVAENMGQPRPPSLHTATLLARPLGYIFAVATAGKGRMPAYSPQLSVADRWAVVAYIRALQSATARSSDETADSLMAERIAQVDSAAAARRR